MYSTDELVEMLYNANEFVVPKKDLKHALESKQIEFLSDVHNYRDLGEWMIGRLSCIGGSDQEYLFDTYWEEFFDYEGFARRYANDAIENDKYITVDRDNGHSSRIKAAFVCRR